MDNYEQDRRVKLANLRAAGIDPYGSAQESVVDNALARSQWEYFLNFTVKGEEGIDRLVMAMTGATSIREIIAFPTLKPI